MPPIDLDEIAPLRHYNTYTIAIPGVQDVVIIPPLESLDLKRERVSRMMRAATPIPRQLQWVPSVVRWIDDAQDLLITALVLGLPLLRRLPTRFIPYLGWVLLGNDILNLFTMFLAAPLTPRPAKAKFLSTVKRSTAGRHGRVKSARAFLLPGRLKWIPFILQAGQALEYVTGYGLRLGTVMGALSDTFWAMIKGLVGNETRLVGPPPSDPVMKAYRFLSNMAYCNDVLEAFNQQEIKIITLAANAAASIIGEVPANYLNDDRLAEFAERNLPIWDAWSPSTKSALEEAGLPPMEAWVHPLLYERHPISMGDAVILSIAQAPAVEIIMARKLRNPTNDFPYGMIATEAAQTYWDVFSAGFDFVVPELSPMERMLGIAIEQAVIPPFLAYPKDDRWASYPPPAGERYGPEIYIHATKETDYVPIADWRLPAAYPPPSDNPHIQLAHWCAIALALFCGRKIALPEYDFTQSPVVTIKGWVTNSRRWKFQAPHQASLLVWGNVYQRWDSPDTPPPADPQHLFRYCSPSAIGNWPGLTENPPQPDWLAAVLRELPVVGTPPGRAEHWPTWTQYPGRDWLDQWLYEHDPRRPEGPPMFIPGPRLGVFEP